MHEKRKLNQISCYRNYLKSQSFGGIIQKHRHPYSGGKPFFTYHGYALYSCATKVVDFIVYRHYLTQQSIVWSVNMVLNRYIFCRKSLQLIRLPSQVHSRFFYFLSSKVCISVYTGIIFFYTM